MLSRGKLQSPPDLMPALLQLSGGHCAEGAYPSRIDELRDPGDDLDPHVWMTLESRCPVLPTCDPRMLTPTRRKVLLKIT